jgi:hypothetical protein
MSHPPPAEDRNSDAAYLEINHLAKVLFLVFLVNPKQLEDSVADPGSGALLTLGSGIGK